MDSSVGHGAKVLAPPSHCLFHHDNSVPHHHHHFHVSPHCPFHSYMLHLKNHSPACPIFASSYPQSQNPETLASVTQPRNPLDLQVSQPEETIFNSSFAMPEDENTGEMEEEEDPVFVLTDEWREFFAKSEAKRRHAKKQARKKGKNQMEQ